MPNMVIQQNIKNKFNNILAKFINNRNNNKFRNNYNKKKFNNYIKFYRNLRIVGSISTILLLTILSLTIYPIVYKENHVLAAAGTAIASDTILTLSEYSSSAGLELLVRDTSGTFARSGEGNTAKFTVSTNNFTGYTLSISSNSNDGKLNNESAGSYLSTIDNITSESVFSTSAALNGMWGYLPSKYNSLPNNSFLPAPTTTATTLDKTTTANTDTNGNTGATTNINDLVANEYTIGLGARVDYTKPAGTYTNTFILSAIANPTNYTITYLDNSEDDSVSNLPSITSSSTSETSIALSDIIPTRTGYTFKSWCLGTVSDNGTICTGTEYSASTESSPSYFGIDQTTTNNTTLYAVWTINTYSLTINFSGNGINSVKLCKVNGNCSGDDLIGEITTSGTSISNLPYNNTYYLYPTFANNSIFSVDNWKNDGSYGTLSTSAGGEAVSNTSATNPTFTIGAGNGEVTITSKSTLLAMQDIAASECPANTVRQVYDVRDYEIYYIQKLADGNCWMLDNLNLDLTNKTVVDTLSSANTNATDAILGYLRSKNGGREYGEQYPTAGLTLSNWTSGLYFSTPRVNVSGTCQFNDDPASCIYSGEYNHNQTVAEATGNPNTVFGLGQGKIGIYYNYCAASAGSYCYGGDNGADTGYSSGDAKYDICPANWRMPTGGTNGEYQALCNAINESDCSTTKQNMDASNPNSLQYQLSIPMSGHFQSGFAYRQGVSAYLFSSTYSSARNMNFLGAYPSYVLLSDSLGRHIGRSVRCILKTTDISQVATMQDFATLPEADKTAVVASMATSTPYLLKDARDNQTYTVAKLADGKVWMLDNLNLDLTDSNIVNKLSQYNTNATNTIIGYLKNGGRSNGDQYPTAGLPTGATDYTDSTGNWSNSVAVNTPLVNKSGVCKATSSDTSCTYDGNYDHDQTIAEVTGSKNISFGLGKGKIGVYYNYCAASAGSYCYDTDYAGDKDSSTFYDVCPNSWRLPTGGASGEYLTLCTTLNDGVACTEETAMDATNTKSLQYQLSTSLTGGFAGAATRQGNSVGFWSSTYRFDATMYMILVDANIVNPIRGAYRRNGWPIRCILN